MAVTMADVLERDAGFCSGGDDDDIEAEDGIHSPTDASEDSVDVKVQAISLRNKNKRKCAEPRRLDTDLPAKKRKISLIAEEKIENSRGPGTEACNPSPFRPWSSSPRPREGPPVTNRIHLPFRPEIYYPQARIPTEYGMVYLPELPSPPHPSLLAPSPLPRAPIPFYTRDLTGFVPSPYVHPSFPVDHYQEEPLSLVSKKKEIDTDSPETEEPPPPLFSPALRLEKNSSFKPVGEETVEPEKTSRTWHSPVVDFSQSSSEDGEKVKEKETNVGSRSKNCAGRSHSDKKSKTVSEKISSIKIEENCHQSDNKFRIDNLLSSVKSESGSTSSTATSSKPSQGAQQRNYKNMTRERRIEANARERTRVHTISAAFDTLRHTIPAYSHNQKLSKLSVLRIACSYIMTLSRLAGYDYSKDQSEPDVADCVDNVSKTIQTEGKIRKKKED